MRVLNAIMFWLFCVTMILVFVPWAKVSPEIAQRVDANRVFLYIALIFEVSNLLCQAIFGYFSRKHDLKVTAARKEYMEKTVNMLDFSERALLREFVLQRKSVLRLPVNEPTVAGLIESRILQVVGNEDDNHKTPVIIAKQARPYITYKAIGLSCGKLTAEQISQLMDSRPQYAREPRPMPKSYRAGGFKVA